MTTNIDRAAEVIALALADDADVSIFGNYNDITTVSEATLDGAYDLTAVARALAEAGLLTPDLPEPDDVDPEREATWVPHPLAYAVYAYKHGLYGAWNVAMDSAPSDLNPEDTRRLAYALLAAADYAEEVGNDEQDD